MGFAARAEHIAIHSSTDIAAVTSQIKVPFTLADYSFDADIPLSHAEFDYLTGFERGQQMTGAALSRALSHLWHKNCFQSIECDLKEQSAGIAIELVLRACWRFEKLKVVGLLVGKDWFKNHYLIEPGDLFDEDKHAHSIEHMRQACHKEGFFNSALDCKLIPNERLKTMTVQLTVNKGPRFTIGQTTLIIDADRQASAADISYLQEQIEKQFVSTHRKTKYAKAALEAQAAAIKQYLSERGYSLASIDLEERVDRTAAAVAVDWHITLGKKRNFVFFGSHFFSFNQFLERILSFGRSAWIVPASILADELKDMYRKKGFWQVAIEGTDEGDRSIFVIKEGKRGIIDEITLRGVHAFEQDMLIKRFFKKIKLHKLFDQQLLQDCFDRLLDFYYARGFSHAKIAVHEVVVREGNYYRLIVTIEEGSCSTVDAVEIPGFQELEKQGPFAQFQQKEKPVALEPALLHEQKQWLTNQFTNQGYVHVAIKHEILKTDHEAVLVWRVTPGAKVTFGKTIIQDTSGLPYHFITRELQYKEHDLWDQDKLRRSFIRLKDRQLFDAISLVPLPLEADGTERPVIVKLHKDDPFEIRTRAGLALQHIRQYRTFGGLTYMAGGTFLVKNPSNNGDYFRFDADIARSQRDVNIRYFYPWIWQQPIDALFHAYAIKYDQPGFLGAKNDLYTIFQNGILGGFQHKTRYFDGALNLGFEVSRTKVGDDIVTQAQAAAFACAIEFNQRLLNKNIPFFFVEPTILIDRLDNNLNPTGGFFTLMSMKGMFPLARQYAGSYFVKMLVEQSGFVSFFNTTLALRGRFGHIFHRVFADIVPNERFYLGGSRSIRSYAPDLAPPLGCFIDDEGNKNIVPRGGKTMLNINIELRFPPIKKLSAVLFNDAGLLCGDDFVDFNSSNVVAGTGFGLRYFTPIGPLRFDIAWKWKKRVPEESSFNWYLNFGQAF